jgi:hypothetical protein
MRLVRRVQPPIDAMKFTTISHAMNQMNVIMSP